MRVIIKPAHQIQRINKLQNELTALRSIDPVEFVKRPHPKAWCSAEVIEHMVVAQSAYAKKLNETLAKLKLADGDVEEIRTRAVPSFLIKRFPPNEGEIRFKMKTTKQFKPMLDIDKLSSEKVIEIIQKMERSLDQLRGWVEQTRNKDVQEIRFNSAVGAMVKFNASEACEFILCHNERHFQQVSNTLNQLKR